MTYFLIEQKAYYTMYDFAWSGEYRDYYKWSGLYVYPSPFAIRELVRRYRQDYATPADHLTSGVIADWLTEHRDELLAGATGPSDPAIRLDALIDYLRARFNSACQT